MSDEANTAPPQPSDPTPDQPAGAARPTRSGRLLGLLRRLIDYGNGLVATLRAQAPAAPTADLASHFGTRGVAVIIARVTRGLMLADALRQRLMRVGRRLDWWDARPAAPSRPDSRATRRTRAPAHGSGRPTLVRLDDDALLDRMPTAEEIAEQVRRRSIAAVLTDICHDLGIVASHPEWAEVLELLTCYVGAVARLYDNVLLRIRAVRPVPPDAPALGLGASVPLTKAATGPP